MVLSDQIAEAKVLDVIWTPSKDGYLKPRVQIEPIVLGGVTIEYATGFNAKFIKDNSIGIGSLIKLVRSGDVIPHIVEVIQSSSEPMMPKEKYIWNETEVDIMLENKETNETVINKTITGFFKIIGVEGLSTGNIKRITEAGNNSIPKIIRMTKDDFLKVEGFKDKLATKISNGISEKIKSTSLPELMQATNIFGRGFGEKRFKLILTAEPDILTSPVSNEEKVDKVKMISGMAEKTANKFVKYIDKFLKWVTEAGLEYKLNENQVISENIDIGHPLYNKKIVMTGFRDNDLIEQLKQVGADMSSTVNKNTYIVIVKDKTISTGKLDEARNLNLAIMTPNEVINMYEL
jgi:NAD-dependent DNA ligase